ncbi:formate/nitrite transporter family protein [Streptomyces sp. NPDC085524]|uniref:formate/nitrite transporter family protein n=1 Tax=unclassified Streptomyces TaxID=2593676 RepID=UPI0035D79482
MMDSTAQNVEATSGQAEHKAHDPGHPPRFGGPVPGRLDVTRARGNAAKIFVLWLPVAVFVAVGFEHCVANMALFGLAILDGSASLSDLFRNLAFTVPGDIVGGGLLVGAVYRFAGGARRGDGMFASE